MIMRWTARSQVVAVTAFLWLYALGVGGAYWIQSRAHDRLETAFQHDLAILALLPRLRDGLRRVDESTDQYLFSGQARWLDERQAALQRVRAAEGVLAGLGNVGAQEDILHQLHEYLADYLGQQNQWIRRRRAGRLPPGWAQNLLIRRRLSDEIARLLGRMNDVNIGELERRRAAVARASRANLGLILLTGMAACGMMSFTLSRYIVGPLERLHDYALRWTLGRPWTLEAPKAGPEIRGLLASMRELTDRVNSQYEKAQELSRLKARLVSMVSHEFNNALTTLGNFIFLLQETEPAAADEKRPQFYVILNSNLRLLALTARNLLDMGRIEEGRFQVRPARTALRPLIEEALRNFEILAQRKSIELRTELPDSPVYARADPATMAMVVTNLISNAIKYTPEQGRVVVGAAPEAGGSGIRVYFADTGIGISAEDQLRLGSDYYRTEPGRQAAKGFGLGLSLCSSVLAAHGSRLEVVSAPGQGSRFSFVLPAWPEGTSEAPKPSGV